jgi:hypothetical protein
VVHYKQNDQIKNKFFKYFSNLFWKNKYKKYLDKNLDYPKKHFFTKNDYSFFNEKIDVYYERIKTGIKCLFFFFV